MSVSSDTLYRAIFEASPDGVLVVDEAGVIRDLNPMVEDMFGYARVRLLGEKVELLVPDSVRAAHAGHRGRFAADPRARPMGMGLELRGRRRDGVEIPVEISLSPLPTPEGSLVIATIRDMTQRKRLRDFGAGALRASEEERQRIARELHDDTAQRLAALLVHLRLLERAEEKGALGRQLDSFREELKEVAEGVRRIARGLRPPELEDAGVVTAIRSHLRTVQEASPIEVELDVDPVDPYLDEDAKLVLYRIVQEAVSNAMRHADASTLRVRVGRDGGDVVAAVEDDGRGFQPSAPPAGGGGLGLVGMQERAVMVGGRVVIDSRPGAGTTVSVRIPAGSAGRAGHDDEAAEIEHV